MKDQTCCFTGHRYIPASEHSALAQRLEAEIENLIHQGARYFAAGGAMGFDTMAAFAVLRLRILHPHIQLILVLPCKNQARGWDRVNKEIYNQIRRQADKVVYISKQYTPGCMLRRNDYLVDHSAVCICYLTNPKSGTAYTFHCAKQHGLRVINLAAAAKAAPMELASSVKT